MDRLEKSGKINVGEKLRLKDVMKDQDGELGKIKVIDNREEVFMKGNE